MRMDSVESRVEDGMRIMGDAGDTDNARSV